MRIEVLSENDNKRLAIVSLPAGSSDDPLDGPHLHHLIEHLIFEMNIPDEEKTYKDWLDERGISSSAATTRDRLDIWFQSDKNVSELVFFDSIDQLYRLEINDNAIAIAAKQVKTEIAMLPTNLAAVSRLSAEFAYWNELNRLDDRLVDETLFHYANLINIYVKHLLKKAVFVCCGFNGEVQFPNILLSDDTPNPLAQALPFRDLSVSSSDILKMIRPRGLQSIVFGHPNPLSETDRFALLILTLMFSRGTRVGVLWNVVNQNEGLYHLMAWSNATNRDAIFVIDWFGRSTSMPIFNSLLSAIKNPEEYCNIGETFSRAKRELLSMFPQADAGMSVSRLRKLAYELSLNEDTSLEYAKEIVLSLKVEHSMSILDLFRSARVLYIDAGGNQFIEGDTQ